MNDADAEVAGSLLVDLSDPAAVDRDRSAVERVDAGDDLAERRLAGAVLAKQGVDLTRRDAHRHGIERAHAGEALRQVPDIEPRRHDHVPTRTAAWTVMAVASLERPAIASISPSTAGNAARQPAPSRPSFRCAASARRSACRPRRWRR